MDVIGPDMMASDDRGIATGGSSKTNDGLWFQLLDFTGQVLKQAGEISALAINSVMVPNSMFIAQKNAAVAGVLRRFEELIYTQG